MHWNDSCPSIWMPKKMMTALHPLNEEASPFECRNQAFTCNL